MKKKFHSEKHSLIPKHTKVSEKEKKEILNRYNITVHELPKIIKDDPAISSLNVETGDVIKIIRDSPTSGEAIFYRVVING